MKASPASVVRSSTLFLLIQTITNKPRLASFYWYTGRTGLFFDSLVVNPRLLEGKHHVRITCTAPQTQSPGPG